MRFGFFTASQSPLFAPFDSIGNAGHTLGAPVFAASGD
jgi:hypothetical protein